MTLAALISKDDHGSLTAELQGEYVSKGDQFILDVGPVDGFALEDASSLRAALELERDARKVAETATKKFKGIDLVKAKAALATVAELGDMSVDDKVTEAMKVREVTLLDKFNGEKTTLEEKIALRTKQLENMLKDNAALIAIENHKGNSKLLLPHIRDFIKMRETDNGDLVAQVVDDKGVERITTKSGSTDAMSIDELVAWFKGQEAYQAAFSGDGQSGSGSTGGPTTGPGTGGTPTVTPSIPGAPVKVALGSIKIKSTDQESINAHWQQIASGEAIVTD